MRSGFSAYLDQSMKKILCLLAAVSACCLTGCTTLENENDAALENAMDEQQALEQSLSASEGCSS
jgi:hypothetical protein